MNCYQNKFKHRKKSDTKYTLEPIRPTSKWFHDLLETFNSSCYYEASPIESEVVAIYKVNENKSEGKVEEHKDNLMLYHGTTAKNSRGILEKGFKNSTKENGFFGAGLYMTESSDVAITYSNLSNLYKSSSENMLYVFLNEVLNSEQLKTVTFTKYGQQTDPTQHPFTRYAHIKSPKPTENDYICDEKGRRYRNTPISRWSTSDEFMVQDASFVKPRFLFELNAKYQPFIRIED